MTNGTGPLTGVRVVEFVGIGPCPFAGMLLGQLGAEVLRIDRAGATAYLPIPPQYDFLNDGKATLALDLKSPSGIAQVLDILAHADIAIEGFRPGVMERLGLGPEPCLARNARLVYGRVTGWGQTGPLAQEAGHDINYIALTGALHAIGPADGAPVPPLNLLGDFAGGGLYLCLGVLAALHAARSTGRGQVVDAAMVDGVSHLMSFIHGLRQAGMWSLNRADNEADGGFPFYGVYATADGGWIATAAAEMKFRRALVAGLDLDPALADQAQERQHWPMVRQQLAAAFLRRSRDEWCARLAGKDACVAPVLDLDEAPDHPHAVARDSFSRDNGVLRARSAPRFSNGTATPPVREVASLLADWAGRD